MGYIIINNSGIIVQTDKLSDFHIGVWKRDWCRVIKAVVIDDERTMRFYEMVEDSDYPLDFGWKQIDSI